MTESYNAFINFLGLKQNSMSQALCLSLLCITIAFLQISFISFSCLSRRTAIKPTSAQKFEDTKKAFMLLVRGALTLSNQHHGTLLNDWLVVKKINTNNYEDEDRSKFRMEFNDHSEKPLKQVDGRKANIIDIDTTAWITEAREKGPNEGKEGNFETPMMKVINDHVRLMVVTSRFEQLNPGMVLSDETKLRRNRLPFKGAVDLLRTLDDKPRFPTALEYSVVRNLKDTKEWNFVEKGLRLDPIILSEKPWPNLMKSADSFLLSFCTDVVIYWLQVLVSVVLLNIIFSD